MKILYISYIKEDSGGFIHTTEFIKAGKRLSHEIILYPPLNNTLQKENYSKNNSARRSFLKHFSLSLAKHCYDFLYLKEVLLKGLFINGRTELKKIKAVNPDLVILRAGAYFSSLFICKLLKIPFLVEVNAPIAENNYKKAINRLRFEKFWSWLLEAKLLKLVENIIVVSEDLRQYYIKMGIDPAHIFPVLNGVDTNHFSFDHPRKNGTIKKFHLNNFKTIGFTGNFRPWHGLEFFLGIMPQIIKEINNVKLLVVGDGPEKAALIRKVHTLGLSEHVVFTGRVAYEDMPAMISVFDVAVAPYAYTDFFYFSPLKIFEYMAAGCGIVAPGLGQINKLIEDGVSGILYDPRDPHELKNGVCRLLNNDQTRVEMGRAARQRVQQKFTWRHNAQNIIQICEAMIKK